MQRSRGPTWQGEPERGKRRGKRRSRTAKPKDCRVENARSTGGRGGRFANHFRGAHDASSVPPLAPQWE
eukprot:12473856-Alexandrium_andersonii.AAC.1